MEKKREKIHQLFSQCCFDSGGIRNVSPGKAFQLCGMGALMLDVRRPYMTAFKVPDVPRLKLIPFDQLASEAEKMSRDEVVLCIDSVGLKSHDAWLLLKELGFTNVANVAGGVVEWERADLPLKIDYKEMLTGSCACQLKARGKRKR